MKRRSVEALKQNGEETPESILAHAQWRESRGHNPSKSYKGQNNPRKALTLATKDFLFKCYKIAARKWLNDLRESTSQYKKLIRYIRKAAQRGKFLLAEIGTSEKELRSFTKIPI